MLYQLKSALAYLYEIFFIGGHFLLAVPLIGLDIDQTCLVGGSGLADFTHSELG